MGWASRANQKAQRAKDGTIEPIVKVGRQPTKRERQFEAEWVKMCDRMAMRGHTPEPLDAHE